MFNYKNAITLVLTLTTCTSFANERGGSGPGNGGGAAGCFDNGVLKHIEFYDFVEARDNGIEIPIQSSMTTDEHLVQVFKRIEFYNPTLAYMFMKLMPVVYEKPILKKGYLNEIGDSKHLYMPQSVCEKLGDMKAEFIQVANYKDSTEKKLANDVVYISGPAFKQMSTIDQAGLYVHEIVYKWHRTFIGGKYDRQSYKFVADEAPKDSSQTRELTALLFAPNLSEDQSKKLSKLLNDLQQSYVESIYFSTSHRDLSLLDGQSVELFQDRIKAFKEASFELKDQSILKLTDKHSRELITSVVADVYADKSQFFSTDRNNKIYLTEDSIVGFAMLMIPPIGAGFWLNEVANFSIFKVSALIEQAQDCSHSADSQCIGKQLNKVYAARSTNDQGLSIKEYSEKILDLVATGAFIRKEGRLKFTYSTEHSYRKNPKGYRYKKIKQLLQ